MTADWVKMRTDIYRDHRVCMMADILERQDSDLARYVAHNKQRDMTVTRNVTRCATVGALVTLWGVTRHRGKRVGDDLLLPGCGLAVLDDIADLPGIGEAMQAVGWAKQLDEGVVLPAFFAEYNADPQETRKQNAAERQRRYRENKAKKSDVTRDVTRCATSNTEKNRIEKSIDREYASQIHDEDIRIPSNVDTPECRAQMDYYFRALNSQRNDRGEKPIDDFIVQENWNIAGQIGPDRLASVISRAITREWKGLLAIDDAKERATKKQLAGLTEQQHAEWVRITAACRMPGQEGVKARAAFPQETAEIMRMIGGSDAVKSTAPGDFREMELRNRFFATREAQRKLQLEGASA